MTSEYTDTVANPGVRLPQAPNSEAPTRNYVERPDYGRPGFGGNVLPAGDTKNSHAVSFQVCAPNQARRMLIIMNLSTTDALWIYPSEKGTQPARANAPSMPLSPAPSAGLPGGVLALENAAISLDGFQGLFPTNDNQPWICWEL